MILAKEQRATNEDIIFWYMADPSRTSNGKSYSSNAAYIDILEYKKWLWNKIKLLLVNTYYFSDDDLRTFKQNLLYSSVSISI